MRRDTHQYSRRSLILTVAVFSVDVDVSFHQETERCLARSMFTVAIKQFLGVDLASMDSLLWLTEKVIKGEFEICEIEHHLLSSFIPFTMSHMSKAN